MFTVILMLFDVAGEPDKHTLALEVMTQVTTLPLANVLEVNVAEFDPTLLPLTFHWYVGAVPPFVGVAVNVTEVPEQMVVALAPIDTLTN